MGTIADKLQKLLGTKEAIRQAIIAKGQAAAEADTFASYADKIRAIQTGIDTSDATAAAGDILSGKTAYGPNGKISGTMPEVVQGTPTISVSTSGLITASATQTAGYVAAGTKSATSQLTTQSAATITPGTAAKTAVASGRYTTGAVTVAGDANLAAGNIRGGVSIFGVTGTLTPFTLSKYVFRLERDPGYTTIARVFFLDENGNMKYLTFSNVSASNMDVYGKRVVVVASFESYAYGTINTTNCVATLLDSPNPNDTKGVKGAVYVVEINENGNTYDYGSNAMVKLGRYET